MACRELDLTTVYHHSPYPEAEEQSDPDGSPKNAVEINVGIYVGDGLDGTLYSSYNCDVKGIGNSEDQAISSAIRKVNPKQEELQEAIAKGKK